MRVLRDDVRRFATIMILTCLAAVLLGTVLRVWQESAVTMKIDFIRTPSVIVAGEEFPITEIGFGRAGCMPNKVARGFYYYVRDAMPPYAMHLHWQLITDAAAPNPVLINDAVKAWRQEPGTSASNTSRAPSADAQGATEQKTQIASPQPIAVTTDVPAPINTHIGQVRYGEQYDFFPCGILHGILPGSPIGAIGPWMTVLPPGSKIPQESKP